MKKKTLIFTFFLFMSVQFLVAQSRMFTTNDGLSSSLITYLLEDHNGMIWVATECGLNRYDGFKFVTYKHREGDPHSLCHNYVSSVFEDSNGRLYVTSYGGIQLYDPYTDSFSEPITMSDGTPYHDITWRVVECIGGMLLTSGTHVLEINYNFEGKPFLNKSHLPIPDYELTDFIVEDKQHNLWVAIGSAKVLKINVDGELTNTYFPSETNMLVTGITEDAEGNIYVSSAGKGVLKYDEESDTFQPISSSKDSPKVILNVLPLPDGNLFVGTEGEGMKLFNSKTKEYSDYSLTSLGRSLDKSKVHQLITDKNDNIWLGIYQQGLMLLPKNTNGFQYAGYKSHTRNNIGSSYVTALCRDSHGKMWVGTDGEGIYNIEIFNPTTYHFPHTSSQTSPPNFIQCLFEDSQGRMWFGSFTDGMGYIDGKTGQCTYQTSLRDREGLQIQRVFDIAEDDDKRLWIATMESGLYCYDMKTGIIKSVPNPNDPFDLFIDCLYYAGDGKLYIGSYKGMSCIDVNFTDKASFQKIIDGRIIYTIHKDFLGNIWSGSLNGLFRYEPYSGDLQHYSSEDGLASDAVYGICDVDNNTLWISTNNGLSKLNTLSGDFSNFYQYDGLQSNEFCRNSVFQDSQEEGGLLWFGGIEGITFFIPNEIIDVPQTHTVRITDFYVNNTSIKNNTKSGRRQIIESSVYDADCFNLAYDDNSFSIELSTLNYAFQSRISYRYSLDGKEWVNVPHGSNIVSFSNLPVGKHVFRAGIVSNSDNISVDKIVTIRIYPPWWASWWAFLCYAFILLVLINVTIGFRHQKNIALRQKEEHLRTEKINEAKQQFFINISHEIRTPMSLIISPLQQLMGTSDDAWHQRTYRTIYRNVERILRLVNQLMDARKIEKGLMSLRFREMEMVGFVADIRDIFSQQAVDRNIDFVYTHDNLEDLRAWIDPANFDKILMNLLSNAFKFTPDGGSIHIDLSETVGHATLSVSDTGIGISDVEKEHIFERFFQANNVANSAKPGTGIGLNLTKSLVELHHGSISVADNPSGKGTVFTVSIPLGKSHLSKDEIDTNDYLNVRYGLQHHDETIPEPLKQYSKTKYRVLIVEDDSEIREYLRSELSASFHVLTASNGKEALDSIFKAEPDIVISDIMMPEMDGNTLCGKIKNNINLNHIPVVLLTAKTQDEDKVLALGIGADAYITKPFSFDILTGTIWNLLKGRDVLKNAYSGTQLQEDKLEKIQAKSPDDRLMERIMKSINKHIADPDISVDDIANEVGISRMHLHRKMKELTNQTTRDFIRNVRLKQAATLLSEKKHSIAEVAYMTGFSNPNNFSTAFKQLYGIPPTKYMESANDKQ